eukprot:COSAG05_NODE_1331_length_5154_cov_14.769733_3_plen_183_part_00
MACSSLRVCVLRTHREEAVNSTVLEDCHVFARGMRKQRHTLQAQPKTKVNAADATQGTLASGVTDGETKEEEVNVGVRSVLGMDGEERREMAGQRLIKLKPGKVSAAALHEIFFFFFLFFFLKPVAMVADAYIYPKKIYCTCMAYLRQGNKWPQISMLYLDLTFAWRVRLLATRENRYLSRN